MRIALKNYQKIPRPNLSSTKQRSLGFEKRISVAVFKKLHRKPILCCHVFLLRLYFMSAKIIR